MEFCVKDFSGTIKPKILKVGPRVKLASCKSALNQPPPPLGGFPLPLGVWEGLQFVIVALPGLFSYLFCSTDRSKAVVPVLVLLFVALWFILRGDLLYVFPCVILCFSVLLVLRLPRLGKRGLISAFRAFVRSVFVWICRFLFLLGSGKCCGL